MKIDMLMPQMGESITEATILRWVKNVGESVAKDETILEITTDKVDSEIPSPASGVLSEILFDENAVVPVKSKIAVIDTEASGTQSVSTADKASDVVEENNVKAEAVAEVEAIDNNKVAEASEDPSSKRFYSPLVKSLANKHGVSFSELDEIRGSGKSGRVTKEDFLAYLDKKQGGEAVAQENQEKTVEVVTPQVTTSAPKPAAPKPVAKPVEKDLPVNQWLDNGTKRVPMDGMRRAIAEHMVRSKQTSPHVYTIQEADVSRIARWRKQHKDEFKQREGISLSFTPFFLEAAIKALQEFPIVNGRIEDQTIVYNKDINLGCAVSIDGGLIVPVIKKADEKNLVGVARSLADLAKRARSKKLNPDEVAGGTFSVTNPGVFGTMIGTPIISQPQSAILCLGGIEKRPVVIDDMIAIRERCYLTLSYDHRIIDGETSAKFLAYICNYLSDWDMDRGLY